MNKEANAFNKEEKIKTGAEIGTFFKSFGRDTYEVALKCLLSVRRVNKVISAGKVQIRHDFLSERSHLIPKTSTRQMISVFLCP